MHSPKKVYFDFIYQPMRGIAGEVEGILMHGVDVTQQLLARREIEKREQQFREMIDELPAAIYTTDATGRLTHFNPAAVEFAGREPQLGSDRWCSSWKLYRPDGTPIPQDQWPMAVALKEGRVISGAEGIAERPDGSRRWFTPYPTPLRNSDGAIIGGINMLVDITERKRTESARWMRSASKRPWSKLPTDCIAPVPWVRFIAQPWWPFAMRCNANMWRSSSTMRLTRCGSSVGEAFPKTTAKPLRDIRHGNAMIPTLSPSVLRTSARLSLTEGMKNTILVEGIHACAFIPLLSDGKSSESS